MIRLPERRQNLSTKRAQAVLGPVARMRAMPPNSLSNRRLQYAAALLPRERQKTNTGNGGRPLIPAGLIKSGGTKLPVYSHDATPDQPKVRRVITKPRNSARDRRIPKSTGFTRAELSPDTNREGFREVESLAQSARDCSRGRANSQYRQVVCKRASRGCREQRAHGLKPDSQQGVQADSAKTLEASNTHTAPRPIKPLEPLKPPRLLKTVKGP